MHNLLCRTVGLLVVVVGVLLHVVLLPVLRLCYAKPLQERLAWLFDLSDTGLLRWLRGVILVLVVLLQMLRMQTVCM